MLWLCTPSSTLPNLGTESALSQQPSAPTTYYISPTGSDSASGTSPSTAWRSAVPASALTLQPGDAVLFEAGSVPHELGGSGLLLRGQGPVLVSVYGGSGPRALLHVDAHATFAVRAQDVAGGVEVCNLTLAHTGAGQALYNGVEALATTVAGAARLPGTVQLHDLEAAGFMYGLWVGAAGCGGFSSVRVARVTATGSLGSGIGSGGAYGQGCWSHADMAVVDSTAHDNPGDAGNAASWSGSGIVLSGVDGALITRSIAYRNGFSNGHAGGGPVGIWLWDTRNGTISHCLSFNNSNGHASGASNDGGGFDLDGGCVGCTVEYSLSFGNAGPGFLVCSFGGPAATLNNTIRYSVSVGDGLGAANGAAGFNWYTPDSLEGVSVHGNTLVSSAPQLPLLAPTQGSRPASRLALSANAFLSLAGAPLLSVPQPPLPASVLGNAYWGGGGGGGGGNSSSGFRAVWGAQEYSSLEALRQGTGLERTAAGAPAGTDTDPHAQPSAFFAACVPAPPQGVALPWVPNSPELNAVRGFAGC